MESEPAEHEETEQPQAFAPALGALIGGGISGALFAAVLAFRFIGRLIDGHAQQGVGWDLYLLSMMFGVLLAIIYLMFGAALAALPGAVAGWWGARQSSPQSGALAGLFIGAVVGGVLGVSSGGSPPPANPGALLVGFFAGTGAWIAIGSTAAGFAAGLLAERSQR